MKQFIAFIIKEFHHILRDRRTTLILIGMPIVQIILFGFAISTEVKNVRTAVLANSSDTYTRRIIDGLNASEYFEVRYLTHSMKEVECLFLQNRIDLAVIFPHDLHHTRYGAESIQLIADATDPNQAITRSTYARGVIASLQPILQEAKGIRLSTRLLYNPQMKSVYNFVPGVMGLILMLICSMMTSISIVREKETGTMEVLLVSPMNPLIVILSKTVPYFVLSVLNLATILLLSVFVLNVPIAGSLWALLGVSLLFIFVSLSLGLFISCITRTQVAAMLISGMVMMIPTILLSGIIFPIESMPDILQAISCIIPARWYIDIVRKLMIEGVPFSYVWHETCILLGMAAILIALTARKFNDHLN